MRGDESRKRSATSRPSCGAPLDGWTDGCMGAWVDAWIDAWILTPTWVPEGPRADYGKLCL